jgi:hypothetical protein
VSRGLDLLWVGLQVKIDANRPACPQGIAGNAEVSHHMQAIQPGDPILTFPDPPPDDRLTGELGRSQSCRDRWWCNYTPP